MAIDCQAVSARMMELLYGELSAEERAHLETHLAGCPSCRAELARFQSTRAAARRALAADEPPARARQAILSAAAAAVAAKQPDTIETGAVRAGASFWDRWRARWTWPTFATIGAVAVVVIGSRIFLEPGRTVQRGHEVTQPAAEAPATSGTPAESPPGVPAREPTARDEALGRPPDLDRGEVHRAAGAGAAREPARATAPPRAHPRRPTSAGGLGAMEPFGERAGASADDRPAKKASSDDSLEDFAARPPSASPARPMPSFAPAPPARAAAKQAPEAESAPSAREEAAASAPAAAGPRAAAGAPNTDRSRAAGKPGAETPVARADRLFSQGRWTEAARAYRDLLRLYPRAADAGRWQKRLADAEAAEHPSTPGE